VTLQDGDAGRPGAQDRRQAAVRARAGAEGQVPSGGNLPFISRPEKTIGVMRVLPKEPMVRKETEDVSRSEIVHCRKEPRLELLG